MKKILVIEDNLKVRENIVEILELADYEVSSAENGKKGVEAAFHASPDLIICDIMMPELDGYGVLHLLGKNPNTRDIPFIFLTAKAEKADFRKGMEMGADDYLTKPFDGVELLSAVEVRLKKAESTREAVRSDLARLTSEDREVIDLRKKQELYRDGQRPKAVYYMVSGKIKTFRTHKDGKDLITHINGPGDFLGYISVLEEANYKETAEVLEDSSVMLIPVEEFRDLIFGDPGVARQFIKLITKNTIEQEENLLNLAYNSLRKKVAFGLVQLLDKFKKEGESTVTLGFSRADMAQAIGVATESFIRTVADFKEENLIDIRDGKIVILNERKLRDLPY